MEVQHFLVPCNGRFHFTIWLISNAVIDEFELWLFDQLVVWFCKMVQFEARKEYACIVNILNKSMCSISISLHR